MVAFRLQQDPSPMTLREGECPLYNSWYILMTIWWRISEKSTFSISLYTYQQCLKSDCFHTLKLITGIIILKYLYVDCFFVESCSWLLPWVSWNEYWEKNRQLAWPLVITECKDRIVCGVEHRPLIYSFILLLFWSLSQVVSTCLKEIIIRPTISVMFIMCQALSYLV